MVLTKEQKEDLLKRLQQGKEKKKKEQEELLKLQEQQEHKQKQPTKKPLINLEDEEEQDLKVRVDDKRAKKSAPSFEEYPVIPFEEPLPEPPTQYLPAKTEPINIPTEKKYFANGESKKTKLYNKDKIEPFVKIKLYREPLNNNTIDNIISSFSNLKTKEPEIKKEVVDIQPKKETPETTKANERKKMIDNLTKMYFG